MLIKFDFSLECKETVVSALMRSLFKSHVYEYLKRNDEIDKQYVFIC